MNGAQALAATLARSGVTTYFANPGTSEMPLVVALDSLNGVLCLFEGVATGAADGYARMLDRPAATLLHMGPGLAYGAPNLHNAARAHSPVVVLVGDHTTGHKAYDPPLASNIEQLAATVSPWVRRCDTAATLATDTADAIAAANTIPGVATLIIPTDLAQASGVHPAPPTPAPPRSTVDDDTIRGLAKVLRSGEPTVLFLGGRALRRGTLTAAGRIGHQHQAARRNPPGPSRARRGQPDLAPFPWQR